MTGVFSDYWSWKLNREQVTLCIARGLDVPPPFTKAAAKRARERRLEKDMERYPLNTIFPMAVVTAATSFVILAIIIGAIVVMIRTEIPWWAGFFPTVLMVTCWTIGSLYMRGYDRVYGDRP